MARTHLGGSWPTSDVWMFGDYVRGSGGVSRDAYVATIGKGNHFVEFQWVEDCLDGRTCYAWGLRKGGVTVMVHTGSVGIGGAVGSHFTGLARELYPRGTPAPKHGFFPIPTVGPLAGQGQSYLSAMGLAANFAVCNRLMLAVLAVQCVSEALGRQVESRLVYDAPHNLVWTKGHDHLHRKGACPAGCDHGDPEFPDGHPIIVPGSMGDSSFVMRGRGNVASLCSAPHGAGRAAARCEGRRRDPSEMKRLRVVTRIDVGKARRDVAEKYMRGLMEEAPSNYKPVLPAMETVSDAGVASPVAKLTPLLTVKA
jgi:tRNA-splicing ligase RtcB